LSRERQRGELTPAHHQRNNPVFRQFGHRPVWSGLHCRSVEYAIVLFPVHVPVPLLIPHDIGSRRQEINSRLHRIAFTSQALQFRRSMTNSPSRP
jgi:hypothetical protein